MQQNEFLQVWQELWEVLVVDVLHLIVGEVQNSAATEFRVALGCGDPVEI